MAPFRAALAQGPDGSPPPCRGAAAPAAARRPNPPLDERTWIVVPFDNVTRAPDIDWLKVASVNLLYLDMSKWKDIRVIDDERVADFIREVPEARGPSLTLQSGMAVARRAGAGKLVMGDLLKVGSHTRVVAKVFDVRTGQRVRTVNQDAANPDSIMSVFGLLARGVLDVEPPVGISVGAIGTTSVSAYQAYLMGVGYLDRWILDSAETQFRSAIEQDSTFALAHYRLSVVKGWQSGATGEALTQADIALRLGASLPPREHELVVGHDLFENGRYSDACDVFSRMLHNDSTDVGAWYELGECSYHDPVVIWVGGDSTRPAFRSSWNTMLHAFHRTLEIDPTFHLAFQHIQDALLSGARSGCRLQAGHDTCNPQSGEYQSALRRSGDTLVTVPAALPGDLPGLLQQQLAAVREHSRRENLLQARREVENWLSAGPNEVRPRMAYARILLESGQIRAADSVARGVGTIRGSRIDVSTFATYRLEIALKSGNVSEAVRLGDSLRGVTDTIPGARFLGIIGQSVFGHPQALQAFILTQIQGPPFVGKYFAAAAKVTLGIPVDSVLSIEAAFLGPITASQGVGRATTLGTPILVWLDPAVRAGHWPAMDSAAVDPRLKLFGALASGDSARMHLAVRRFDSLVTSLAEEPDAGFALARANAHLILGDSAGALAAMRLFRDSTFVHSPLLSQISPGFTFEGMVWARSFLLLGDLAAAAGQRDEARRAYQMFVAMWQGGDDEVQPLVRRARESLGRLGG
jgi:TolB-like protein